MPWFEMKCTVCDNRDELLLDEAPADGKDLGACTMGSDDLSQPHGHCPVDCEGCACFASPPCTHCVEHHPCEGRMVRAWSAPRIGRGTSGKTPPR